MVEAIARWTMLGRAASWALVLVISACGSAPRKEAAPAYPESLPRGEVLDIQLRRDVTQVTLTNTSSRDLSRAVLWLNMRFAQRLGSFMPGQTITLDLEAFRDEFGAEFRAGGFFSSEAPDPIVLAQVQTKAESGTDELVGLIPVASRRR